MKVLASLVAAAALLVAPAAFADGDAGGVGIGGGVFGSSASSSGSLSGPVQAHIGTTNFSQTVGTATSSSIGLGVATSAETTLGVPFVSPTIRTSSASVQAFSNASAATTVAQQGAGIGLVSGAAASNGSAGAFGAFIGAGFAVADSIN